MSVSAVIANTGNASGTFTAGLQINGTSVSNQQLWVPANGTRVVEFTHLFEASGTYAVAVNETSAGTVAVIQATPTATATPPDTPTGTVSSPEPPETLTTTSGPGTDGRPIPGATIWFVILLVVAGWLLVVLWRRRGED